MDLDFFCEKEEVNPKTVEAFLKKKKYGLKKLILDAKAKFDWDIDRLTLVSQFLRAKELTEIPKMLVAFDRKKMEGFFLKLAKNLEKEIFL